MNAAAARILVVDDEAAALKNLVHLLRKEGYAVTACQSGTAGLKAVQQHEFDVVS
jgi:two-component system response regulator HydG